VLRVGYDLTGLELDASGTARAIRSLRDALLARDDVRLLDVAQPGGGGRIRRGLLREGWWYPAGLGWHGRALGLDVLHCPAGLAPRRSRLPVVVTVNDAMAVLHPEWFTRANVLQQRMALGPALRRAAAVLTPSASAAAEVAAAFGVDHERIAVTPYGLDARFSPGDPPPHMTERLGLDGPWILTVGTLQPRKNVEAALRAFEDLHAGGAPHRLVVAGARGWGDEELSERLRRSPAAGAIRLPGRVSDADLVGLYRGADAFVFPSRHEGFGFPPLEALACGCPVVSSDRGSLPEVVGDAGLLADPDDDEAFGAALRAALDPARGEELRRRGPERAARFTWERCAAQTVEAYRGAAAS
jgi:alpha-1,3-rhamnosyl/mannosyltransferase